MQKQSKLLKVARKKSEIILQEATGRLTADKLPSKKSCSAGSCLSNNRSKKMMEYGGIKGLANGLPA